MPKGRFTQCVCVLLEKPISLDEIALQLNDFVVAKRLDETEEWVFGGPTLVVEYLPEKNGCVAVDIVDRPWPDGMGDPQNETMLFGAWTLGHFGPFTFPGGLERAGQQSWTWEPGLTIAQRHTAFIRFLVSYVIGADDDALVIPREYDPLHELEFITKLASAVLDAPHALCYFNPNGELLRDQDGIREALNFAWSNEIPALDIWSNIRLFNINEEWAMMDTVGNGQLDITDNEAVFVKDSYDMNQVDRFLRNISLCSVNNGEIIKDGDTMDGPGDIRWQARQIEEAMSSPPRPVLRWQPQDGREFP